MINVKTPLVIYLDSKSNINHTHVWYMLRYYFVYLQYHFKVYKIWQISLVTQELVPPNKV